MARVLPAVVALGMFAFLPVREYARRQVMQGFGLSEPSLAALAAKSVAKRARAAAEAVSASQDSD